ncbi:uncharacterized protein LOC110010526 isoform X2 [Jatropha curcas]|uniref:uncharacterized protein LOC110010526 isoform X2 n=1 Tax=Jatropha curcas TaxID=180498 RepID=UPI0018957476|nr:uncharacterized protein LOC110010526 isoform X2 [Jatropha curcas]
MLMNRIVERRKDATKWVTNIAPVSIEKLERNMLRACNCHVEYNGDDGYEISEEKDRHTVDIVKRSCSCRSWDISGIPCPHCICVVYHKKGNILDYIDGWYSKKKFLLAYNYTLQLFSGRLLWPRIGRGPILPPESKKMPGRPKRNRVQDLEEPKKCVKRSRRCVQMTCSLCKCKGHNKSGCKNKGMNNEEINQGLQNEDPHLDATIRDFAPFLFDSHLVGGTNSAGNINKFN